MSRKQTKKRSFGKASASPAPTASSPTATNTSSPSGAEAMPPKYQEILTDIKHIGVISGLILLAFILLYVADVSWGLF